MNLEANHGLVLHRSPCYGKDATAALQSGERSSDTSLVMFVGPSRTTRLILSVLLGSVLAGCVTSRPAPPTELPAATTLTLPGTIRVRTGGRIVTIPFEDYVLGTALSEVSPVNESPETVATIFQLQVVIARTYAASQLGKHRKEGFDLCDSTHCQIYEPARIGTSRFTPAARQAISLTRGQVLAFSLRPTQALFHADCGGHTAAAQVIWGGRAVPYLPGTRDDVPETAHRTWNFETSAEQLRTALNRDPLTAVGARLDELRVVSRDPSGRASMVEVRGDRTHQVRGEQLRAILNATFGARALMSARFSVAHGRESYRFDGTGFGHGVGLCQVGAAARARRGETLEGILAAYFPGARLMVTRPSPL